MALLPCDGPTLNRISRLLHKEQISVFLQPGKDDLDRENTGHI
jgi:hypothetical protein